MEMTTLDQSAYADMLSSKLPHVIDDDTEYERFLGEVQQLIRRQDLSVAEEQFLDLLTVLIEKYEEDRFALPLGNPPTIIKELMAAQNVSQAELAKVIGSKGNTSEILA